MNSRRLIASIRKHLGGAMWAAADQGINPVLQLALTPFFLARLGRQDFGLWVLGVTVVNMSQIVSCGAGMAATKHVSADLGAGAPSQAVAVVRGAVFVALAGGSVAALLLWTFAPLLAATAFGRLGSPALVAAVLGMAGVAAAIQEIDSVYAGALRGAERFDLSAKVEIPARIAMSLVSIHLASGPGSVRSVFLGLILTMTLKAGWKGRQVCVLFDDARCVLPSMAPQSLRRILQFGIWQWLQATGSALFTSMDQLLVGGLLGSAALTRYSVCLQLAQYVHMIPSVMMQVVFPRVSAIGRDLGAHLRNAILRSATIVGVGTAMALGFSLVLFAHPLLSAWISADFADHNLWLLILLVVIHVILAINIGAYYVLLGTGESARSAKIVLAAAIAQSLAAVVLAPLGLLAFACNRLVYAIGTAWLFRAARADSNEC